MNRPICLVMILLGVALTSICCQSIVPTLYAQSVPAIVHEFWEPIGPAEDYLVTLDNEPPIVVPGTVFTTPVTVKAFGHHTLTVVARNHELTGDPAQVEQGPEHLSSPLVISFDLNGQPGGVKNGKVTN